MVHIRIAGMLSLAALLGGPAVAQTEANQSDAKKRASPISVEVTAGAEYDSNVSVNDIDTNTGSDDFAAVFDGDVSFAPDLGEGTSLELGYGFSQSLYNEFDAFNLQSHLVTADLSREYKGFEFGGAYRFSHARLGGAPFLTMHQIAPYFSRFLGESVYVRAEYAYSDKNFIGRTDRDARTHAGSGDVYFFMRGAKTYFSAGYKYESENAVDPQFDYVGHGARIRLSHKIPMGRRFVTMKAGYRFEDRSYSAPTPSIGVARQDQRHRLQSEVEIPIDDTFFARLEFEHADFQSNLPSADFTQNVGSAKLGARF
ncbi:MAG: hypothetical protein K2Q06_13560 [Parvularculaceae bacterium]|nr:hypothetical protein [Parvularculaceae bacterium]